MRTALLSGVASALAVCAIFLAAGAFDGEAGRSSAGDSATTTTTAPSIADVYRRARRSVVLIDHRPPGVRPRSGPPSRGDRIATGSGFAIDRSGHIVTNQHIVAGRGTTTVQFDPGSDPAPATVAGRDASTDLAVLRVDRGDRPARLAPLPLGNSGDVRVGDVAIVIGNPFGLERSLSVGVVSALARRMSAPDGTRVRNVVQTDAPINPGNSGGPLLDEAGRVIGVVTQGRGEGVAFAVPVDTVKRVADRLRRGSG